MSDHAKLPTGRLILRKLLAACSSLLSLLAIVGWITDTPSLRQIFPSFPELMPNAAFALFFACVALLFTWKTKKLIRIAVSAAAAAALFISGTTLSEYIFGLDLRIDQLVFTDPNIANAFPGRMSPHVALPILLVAVSLLLIPHRRLRLLSEVAALAAVGVTFAAILGHVYGAELLYSETKYTLMAPQGALTLLMLGVGCVAANPDSRVVALMIGDTAGSAAARWLVPAAITVPTLFGWLRIIGQQHGFYDTGFGASMMTMSSVTFMCVFIFYFSRMIDRAELKNRADEARGADRERRYRLLVDHGQGLICTHDLDGKITSINPSGCTLLGLTEEQVIGRTFADMMPPELSGEFSAYLRKIANEGIADGLLSLRSMKGPVFTLQYHNILVFEEGYEPYVLGHAQDVTLLLEAQRRLKDLSDRDELTGLFNRRGFLAMADQLVKLEKHSGTARGLSLLFADMDGLKAINDTHGHEAGSTAIAEIARILKSAVRDADVVARWGGDEFVILSVGCDEETSELVVERMQRLVREHNDKTLEPFSIGVSIGIAEHRLGGEMSIERVIAEADLAMYEEKKRRKAWAIVPADRVAEIEPV